jgi:hypothetical protein
MVGTDESKDAETTPEDTQQNCVVIVSYAKRGLRAIAYDAHPLLNSKTPCDAMRCDPIFPAQMRPDAKS